MARNRIRKPLLISFVASLGGLIYGVDSGMASSGLSSISSKNKIDPTLTAVASSIAAIFGILIGSWLSDRISRKWAIQTGNLVYVLGSLIILADTTETLLLGRVINGIGVGTLTVVPPLYIAEISTGFRGAHIAVNGLLITAGVLVSALLNIRSSSKNTGQWRFMLVVSSVFAVIQFLLLMLCPRSPWWLWRKGKEEELQETLEDLYPPGEVQGQLQILRAEQTTELNNTFLLDVLAALLSQSMRNALYVGISVQALQQLMSVKSALYYQSHVLKKLHPFFGLLLSILTPILDVIGTFIGVLSVDRFGRRKLALISFSSLIIGLILYVIYFVCDSNQDAPPKCSNPLYIFSFILFIIYVLLYTPGMETVPYIINSEFFSLQFRSIGGGISAIANLLSNLFVTHLTESFGVKPVSFIIFAILSIFLIVYLYKKFPETQHLTLQDAWRLFEPDISSGSTSVSEGSDDDRHSDDDTGEIGRTTDEIRLIQMQRNVRV